MVTTDEEVETVLSSGITFTLASKVKHPFDLKSADRN